MIRELWKRFDTAMVGYWIPTSATVLSLTVTIVSGVLLDKKFFLFLIVFIPLLLFMWMLVWSWEHPHPRHCSRLPYDDDWPLDRRSE